MAVIVPFPGRSSLLIRVVKEPAPASFDAATIKRNTKACADALRDCVRMCSALLGAAAVAAQLRATADGLDVVAEREARYQ